MDFARKDDWIKAEVGADPKNRLMILIRNKEKMAWNAVRQNEM